MGPAERPLAAVYAFLSPLRLFQGDEQAALDVARLGVERCRDLSSPAGRSAWPSSGPTRHGCTGSGATLAASVAAAEEAARLGEQLEFFEWATAGRMHKAAALMADAPTVEGLEELGRAIAAFRVGGGEWTVTSVQLDQGWGYVVLGDIERAEACLRDAEEVIGHLQQTSVAEAHRLRAELLARRYGPSVEVERELAAGLRVALGQEAQLYVLRCGATFERWLGRERLDPELRAAYERALDIYGPEPEKLRRFLGAEAVLAGMSRSDSPARPISPSPA